MEVLIGFAIAAVTALTGVGSGSMTAPLLILFLHVPIEIAVSTALAYSAVVKLVAAPVQMRRKQVVYPVLGAMLLGGLPGVVLGSVLLRRAAVHGSNALLYAILGAVIVTTSGWHIYRHFIPAATPRPKTNRRGWIAAVMLPIGAEVGFSASGAGALGTVALLSLSSLSAAEVVGTDLTFGLCLALAGSAAHLTGGSLDAMLLGKLALGGVAGALAGSGVAPRIPDRQLRFALFLWLLAVGIDFCRQAARW